MGTIKIAELSKAFDGFTVLQDLTFSIGRGEFVSVVGPSGCGKTTLLRLIAGLIQPSRGTIETGGESTQVSNVSSIRIGYVFQDPTLLPWRTAISNVTLPVELRRPNFSRSDDTGALATEALEMVGMSDFSDCYPPQLSRGQRMRVSLARALIGQPDLLLLDEPFASIDVITRYKLADDLQKLWRDFRWTTIMVTHDYSEAVRMSERVLVLGNRPAKIVDDVPVPLQYPRNALTEWTPVFRETVELVRTSLERSYRLDG